MIAQAPYQTKVKEIISINNLYKSFGSLKVLQDFSLDVNEGENVVVMGRSGSGKTVLIKCIVGLVKPDRGSITINGIDISSLNYVELDKIRQQIGFVFQKGALYDSMTIEENLTFHLRNTPLKHDKKARDERIEEVLESVGLLHTLRMMPSELSGGMQKRVSLARSLVLYPKIMLYDEPTAGLDPGTTKEISHLIVEVQRKYKIASLIITHDVACARITADRIVILIDGKCYAMGTFEEIESSDDPNIKQFFF